MPVRTAQPENLVGLVEKLDSPAYSTSVGLLQWALTMHGQDLAMGNTRRDRRGRKGESSVNLDDIKNWINRLLP